MTSLTVGVPTMYADHHVVEVRRILSEIPGVERINASAAFQVVEIGFDPERTSADVLRRTLDEAGYLGPLPIPAESGKPAVGRDGATYFRHTAAVEAAGSTVSFGQDIAFAGRALWPCPGMGSGRQMDEGEAEHGG
ncbi:MAG: heavy-metal-associated domain-containing protein [Actinobacteria bacterium]|nr:heavy-metal-associated domain-containing protein [Actinomycetota bacterium]